jgi:hypothetical protein
LYREEKYASIYEINMLLHFFAVYVKMHVQKTLSIDYLKTLVASSYEDFYLWKDRLVMPLDMQNAQLKKTN